MPRYPSPYPALGRPPFLPRPPGAIGVLPVVSRPLVPGMRPLGPPVFMRPPIIPAVTPAEKPLTTIYVSKIPVTADNEFMLSLFKFCGPVKSWKRPQDLRNGTPKGFGFCEFETAEGVLRALRLLSKFCLDGQELALIVDHATTEYLERYVEKKTENSKKLKENQVGVSEKENEKKEPSKEDSKNDDPDKKETRDMASFGIVTDEDKEVDREALEKLKSTTEEWLKTRPPPPPPPPPPQQSAADAIVNSNADLPAKSGDGDSNVKSDTGEDKNGDETTSDIKTTGGEHDKPESSPDRRRYDRRGRDNNREKRDREIDRYEREAERERVRKEREQRRKLEDAERKYEECLKDWEYREKDKERQRNHVKDREKERERKRKREVLYDEEEDDDDSRRRSSRRSILEEKRKRRQREKEDDMADRLLEEEEIIEEAKRRAEEEEKQRDSLKHLPADVIMNGDEKPEQSTTEINNKPDNQDYQGDSDHENDMIMDDVVMENGTHDEPAIASVTESDTHQQPRKLGFGLSGSGKRSTVPSVFNEEDDDEEGKDKKMRPLVPIDYSTEEIQAVQQPTVSVSGATPPNLAAAAEFAKRISNVSSKEEKTDTERDRSSKRSHDRDRDRSRDRSSQRDKDRNDTKEDGKGKNNDRHKDRDHGIDKAKTPDNKKLLDAKQLIDMIPKTKEELFSYEINWAVYDKHEIHERLRPWISKKITEFLGEEEKSLIDYIVSSTREHMKASEMLEQLQSILDEEAEMFILKMWRMLIFEIKKVETGLSFRPSRT